MKKILANSSIRNKRLRESSIHPLLKTAIHRYNYDAETFYKKWFDSLDGWGKMMVWNRGILPTGYYFTPPYSRGLLKTK